MVWHLTRGHVKQHQLSETATQLSKRWISSWNKWSESNNGYILKSGQNEPPTQFYKPATSIENGPILLLRLQSKTFQYLFPYKRQKSDSMFKCNVISSRILKSLLLKLPSFGCFIKHLHPGRYFLHKLPPILWVLSIWITRNFSQIWIINIFQGKMYSSPFGISDESAFYFSIEKENYID